MNRRDFPAVHLRNIPQMHHVGKVPFGYGDGRFFNLTGPYRTDTAPRSSQREHANPVEKASQLNVRHGPGCRVPSRQDVLETIRAAERAEAAYDRRMYRYKAHYSLDCDNGIENAILLKPQTPETLLEEKQLREQLYAAVMALPEKQAKRIYARYYLGMRVSEISAAEGVDPSRVRDSIRRGLKQLAKYF